MAEKDIQNTILSWLALQPNVVAWRQPTIGTYDKSKGRWLSLTGYARKGISDILGVISPDGIFLAIEVKTPKTRNRVTSHQLSFLDDIKRMGGIAFVATSLDEVVEKLEPYIGYSKDTDATDWMDA